MDSKRSSLEGRNTLWKDTMSRVMIGVKRSSSNNPIEDITMSTTGSKSSKVEAMGDNATYLTYGGGDTVCIHEPFREAIQVGSMNEI
jgi:hypothetical protein